RVRERVQRLGDGRRIHHVEFACQRDDLARAVRAPREREGFGFRIHNGLGPPPAGHSANATHAPRAEHTKDAPGRALAAARPAIEDAWARRTSSPPRTSEVRPHPPRGEASTLGAAHTRELAGSG